mgnify:CR=1 FL=1
MVTNTPPTTRTDRQLLALQRQAKKYPSAKKKIKQIKDNRRRSDWLSQ